MAVFVFGQPGAAPSRPIPTPLANFADNSWEEIALVCQANVVPETWVVGDSKIMEIDNVEYQVDIIGKNHDVYSDGTGIAPLTFQLHDLYHVEHVMNASNTNTGGWEFCEMRTIHLPTILSAMPIMVQRHIRKVQKLNANNGDALLHVTDDKLFFLSEVEVRGSVTYSITAEGKQYEYYLTAGRFVKRKAGATDIWWLRSPRVSNTTQFCVVSSSGLANVNTPNRANPLSFAFCF